MHPSSRKPRPAFLLTAAAIFGLSLLGILAFMSILGFITDTLAPTIPDILTDIPTLNDYDADGNIEVDAGSEGKYPPELQTQIQELLDQKQILHDEWVQAGTDGDPTATQEYQEKSDAIDIQISELEASSFSNFNERLKIYWFFAIPSLMILFFMLFIGVSVYYFEKGLSLFNQGTASKLLKTSIIGIIVILVFPEFWDTYALGMEQFSLYLMDPFNQNPDLVVSQLWCKMKCLIDKDAILDQDTWTRALFEPGAFGQTIIAGALLPLFKILPATMLTISLFVIGTIRVLFIMIIAVTLPLWMVTQTLPFVNKIGNTMISTMIGASIAPMFSALTMFVGLSYVNSSELLPLQNWVSVLGVGLLAAFWPIILAPALGTIANAATSMVQTAIQSTAMMASGTAAGAGSGMSRGLLKNKIGMGGASGGTDGIEDIEVSRMGKFKSIMGAGLEGAVQGAGRMAPGVMAYGMQSQMMQAHADPGMHQSMMPMQPIPQDVSPVSNTQVSNSAPIAPSTPQTSTPQNTSQQTLDNFNSNTNNQ